MKIDKVIFASNDSSYLKFWELNSEITLKKLGITPVLFHITDEESDFYEDKFGLVKKVKQLPNYSTTTQAQNIRMYATKYFPEEVCMISDIDMFLFDVDYLNKYTKNLDEDSLLILNSDAYDPVRKECVGMFAGPDRYPICYNIGKGKTFNKILNTDISFENYMGKVESMGFPGNNDELYYGKLVNRNTEVTIHKVKRGYCSDFWVPQRIEKFHFYEENQLPFRLSVLGDITISSFIDCHCPTPYKKYETLIHKIKNQILR